MSALLNNGSHQSESDDVTIWHVKLNSRGLSEVCSQCGADATLYGHEAIAYCKTCWDAVEIPWKQAHPIETTPAMQGALTPDELAMRLEQINREVADLLFPQLEKALSQYAGDDVLPVWKNGLRQIMTKDAYVRELRLNILSGDDKLKQALTEIRKKLVAFGGCAS